MTNSVRFAQMHKIAGSIHPQTRPNYRTKAAHIDGTQRRYEQRVTNARIPIEWRLVSIPCESRSF
jgi:hypothetical protein